MVVTIAVLIVIVGVAVTNRHADTTAVCCLEPELPRCSAIIEKNEPQLGQQQQQ
jgi:hypothetical protein